MLGLGIDSTMMYGFSGMDLKEATSSVVPQRLALWLKNNTIVAANRWGDSSGYDNHATQGTEANQAAVSGGGLDFEASESDHYDLTSTITIAENQGFCFVAVLELETSSGVVLSKDVNDQIRITSDTNFRFKANDPSSVVTNAVFPSNTFPTGQKFLFLVNRSAGASNRFTFMKNGVVLTADTDTSQNEAAGENPNGFDLNVIGAKGGSQDFFDGKILELAFWQGPLTAQEIVDVNYYLKHIHGL